jgi:hypothetical protein
METELLGAETVGQKEANVGLRLVKHTNILGSKYFACSTKLSSRNGRNESQQQRSPNSDKIIFTR